MAKTVIEECLHHAMTPNMKKGKTELLLTFRGKGSRQLRSDFFNVAEPVLSIPVEQQGFSELRLTPIYKHLGTRVHTSTKMMPELKTRMGQTMATYRKHRKLVFQNNKIELRRRVFLFQSDLEHPQIQCRNLDSLDQVGIQILQDQTVYDVQRSIEEIYSRGGASPLECREDPFQGWTARCCDSVD